MFDRPPPESALHRLQNEELCIITVDGKEYGATWSANVFRFYLRDGRSVHHSEVEQWRPAGVKF